MSTSEAAEMRKDAAGALGAASAAVHPTHTGIGQKMAIAGTIYRLARRYPVAAVMVAAVALALYVTRRRAYSVVTRH
jgi:hypothetical protein